MEAITLTDKIEKVTGIGAKTAALYRKLNIDTVSDLLEYYPVNYDEFKLPCEISEVSEGRTVTIEGAIATRLSMFKKGNLTIMSCYINDPSGRIKAVWFNQPYLKNKLELGNHYVFRGLVSRKNAELILDQPKLYTKDEYRKAMKELRPVYHQTKGLGSTAISKAVKNAYEANTDFTDFLPKNIIKEAELCKYKDALYDIHFPKDAGELTEARRRLSFNEFFLFMLSVRQLKEKKTKAENRYFIPFADECQELMGKLPYSLTNAQKKVLSEIFEDMSSDHVMSRLIQGDVGSGKTIVAMISMLACAKAGFQSCLMAPTEVLAGQHYDEFTSLLAGFKVRCILLVGSMTAGEKRSAYAAIAAHEVDIIIGTHALIQDKVVYDKLGLVITDEQHRFGVRQRESLEKKGDSPHIIVMSATPIPRSLSLILYGDLDISIINELPANRLPIKNCVVDEGFRPKAYSFISRQIEEGHQAYIICSMVEESEKTDAENVVDYTEKLRQVLPSFVTVEYLHGQMKNDDKNAIMDRFKRNEIQVLVSTTVVEVGVNVPNATVMMVENAERFGLAQLHQLRGRVGRGSAQSYCIFVMGSKGKEIEERLNTLVKYNDGFKIAEEDLRLRGPGDLFGIRQSGEMAFKIGDIINDAATLKLASDIVNRLTEEEAESIIKAREKLFGPMKNGNYVL